MPIRPAGTFSSFHGPALSRRYKAIRFHIGFGINAHTWFIQYLVTYMETYPLNIPGITGKTGNKFVFNDDANKETFRLLVEDIPPQTVVGFYDKKHSSPSDPGAYVIFRRLDEQYVFQRANHGWSSQWKPISVEKLLAYLSRCAKYNYGTNPSEHMFSYVSVKPPKLQKW